MNSKMKLYSFAFGEGYPYEIFAPLSVLPYSLFFDSSDHLHELGRYSFIAFHPFEIIESKNGRVSVTNKDQQLAFDALALDTLKERLELYGLDKQNRSDLPPFQGGAAGFFGYDLVRGLEKIPQQAQDNENMPDMAIGLYDQVYAYDHHKKTGWFMVHAQDEQTAKARYAHFIKRTQDQVKSETSAFSGDSYWKSSHTKRQYKEAVQRAIDYIYAGDIFQCNLSQKFEAELPQGFSPWDHYLGLRRVNSAPFAGFMNFGSFMLSSASPERFLFVQNRQVETRPIKGTARRLEEEGVDRIYRNHLENSKKDRAENTMIVDLMRNDLSKVCEDHAIDVPQLCKLESFAKVHHLVSVVTGTLRADQSAVDLLRACFPGGSITGAPKIRAMHIIEELEKTRRGAYCGAMGYINFNGTMDTNIIIRTLVYQDNKVSFNVGGGIVADSVPEDEYDETMVKAEAIFNSFELLAMENLQKEMKAEQ